MSDIIKTFEAISYNRILLEAERPVGKHYAQPIPEIEMPRALSKYNVFSYLQKTALLGANHEGTEAVDLTPQYLS
ncbi:hypothetical protein INT47_012453 [Mucor saturninus]|uniref:Uncharacterized protein n=1 Tax=Mucor saturninus TaxID=64648 RepID=A0A8H7QXI3_9FUNG|nr:hypothetical protein INT47_012453 [Mucor saturninus]